MAEHRYRSEQNTIKKQKISSLTSQMPGFVSTYFQALEQQNMATGTMLGYAYDLKNFFEYFIRHKRPICTLKELEALTTQDIRNYLTDTSRYNKNGKTITVGEERNKRKIASLRGFYSFFFKEDLIATNPTAKIVVPKSHKKQIISLDPEEVDMIFETVENPTGSSQKKTAQSKTMTRDKAILSILLGTGIRVTELVGLDVGDIDIRNASIRIIRKGGNEDIVYFGEEIEKAILDYWGTDRESFHPCVEDADALFLSLHHKRITVRSVENLVKKYAKDAKIKKKITPHKCRTTFGQTLYDDTHDLYLTADALGHSNVETTKRHYASVKKDKKRIAASIGSDLLKRV